MGRTLPFRVVESDSCAKGFPASSLHDNTPHVSMWSVGATLRLCASSDRTHAMLAS